MRQYIIALKLTLGAVCVFTDARRWRRLRLTFNESRASRPAALLYHRLLYHHVKYVENKLAGHLLPLYVTLRAL